ncbi:MATE family efflux transporter, partial [Variovorax sp. RHLX14]
PSPWWGSHYGAAGVLIGQAVVSSIFGLLAVVVAFRLAAKLARQEAPDAAPAPVLDAPVAPTSALATPQPAVAATGPAASAAAP